MQTSIYNRIIFTIYYLIVLRYNFIHPIISSVLDKQFLSLYAPFEDLNIQNKERGTGDEITFCGT